MIRPIYTKVPDAIELVKRNLRMGRKGERVMIIGVGNTCGVGNNAKAADAALRVLEVQHRKRKKEEKKKKEKKHWF